MPVNSNVVRGCPLAEVQGNRDVDERGRKRALCSEEKMREMRAKLKETYALMRKDVKEYRALKRMWEEGGHYRTALGLQKTARSREVLQAVKERCMLWHRDERNLFIKKCLQAELVLEPALPWPDTVSEAVYNMWSNMKREIKMKLEQQNQQQVPPLVQELYPFAPVSCGPRTPAINGNAVSGVFTGLPVTAVPVVDLPRVVKWPEPHLWNEAYTGNLEALKAILKDDMTQIDALGYLKTKPTEEISEAQRLGIKRLRNDDGTTTHALLPAPPGEETRGTPLHYAIIGGQHDVIKWLLKKGASTDFSCQQGSNAMLIAAKPPRPEVQKLLVERHDRKEKGVFKRIAEMFLS